MKITPYLFLLIVLFFGKNGFGQTKQDSITKLTFFGYKYQGKFYLKSDLGREVLKQDELAYEAFYDFQTSRLISTSSITYIFIQASLHFRDYESRYPCQRCIRLPQKYFDPLLATMAVAGGVSIITFVRSRIKLLKAIRLFNEGKRKPKDVGSRSIKLDLQPTQNGIGLVLNF